MIEVQLDKLKQRGINAYQAVIMAATEARDLNDKINLGIMEAENKPTTMALEKLMDGSVVIAEEDGIES